MVYLTQVQYHITLSSVSCWPVLGSTLEWIQRGTFRRSFVRIDTRRSRLRK